MAQAKYRERLTAQRLRQLLHYDPSSGVFTWCHVPPSTYNVKVGDQAGCLQSGYIRIRINGHLIYAHCLAWLWMTGVWPEDQVDHRNTVRNDNRWKNLRPGSALINAENRKRANANNDSGRLGVGYSLSHRKFVARIMTNRKPHHIGYYETADQAYVAYVTAKRVLHAGGTL